MIATDESLKKLTTVPSEQDAAIIVAALNDEGIDACYMGETTANFRVGVPGKIFVYVSKIEWERARRIFEERESAALAPSSDDEQLATPTNWLWNSLVLVMLFFFLLIGLGSPL